MNSRPDHHNTHRILDVLFKKYHLSSCIIILKNSYFQKSVLDQPGQLLQVCSLRKLQYNVCFTYITDWRISSSRMQKYGQDVFNRMTNYHLIMFLLSFYGDMYSVIMDLWDFHLQTQRLASVTPADFWCALVIIIKSLQLERHFW